MVWPALGPEAAAGSRTALLLTINLSGDGVITSCTLTNQSNPMRSMLIPTTTVDTDVTATPWGMFAASSTKKKDGDDGGQGHI